MNLLHKYAVCFLLLGYYMPAVSQGEVPDSVGDLDKNINISRFNSDLSAAKGIGGVQRASMKRSVAGQLDILYQVAALNPPTGFNGHCTFSFETISDFNHLLMPTCEVRLNLTPLIRDRITGRVKAAPGSYSALIIRSNSLEKIYDQSGSYCKDCGGLHVPVFFEGVPVIDSTADYVEIGRKNSKDKYDADNELIRVVRKNNKPIFVPYTRKEFIQYLMARTNVNIANAKSSHEDDRAQQLQQALTHYREITAAMTRQEADAPVRIDYSKEISEDLSDAMVPAGRREGIALYKVNPDYYDRSPGAPAVQLMQVSYMIPYFGRQTNNTGRRTIDIFNQLDYRALKESMQ